MVVEQLTLLQYICCIFGVHVMYKNKTLQRVRRRPELPSETYTFFLIRINKNETTVLYVLIDTMNEMFTLGIVHKILLFKIYVA